MVNWYKMFKIPFQISMKAWLYLRPGFYSKSKSIGNIFYQTILMHLFTSYCQRLTDGFLLG